MKKRNRVAYLYLLPWLFGTLVFVFYPFISSLVLSFTKYDLINSPTFIGFDNYINLFKDETFRKSIFATIKYTVLTVPLQLAFALFVAFILNFKIKGIGFFRSAFYLPSILGGNVAIAILWRFIFRPDGLINQLLNFFGIPSVQWFSSPTAAMVVLVILKVWQFGSSMLIFLAALQEIPRDLYEASYMDGASKVRTFFSVTIPLLTPTILFNLIMQLVNAFQEFNGPYLVTQGGPLQSTYLASMFIYDYAFKFYQMGYSSAASWILFILIALFTGILFKTQKRWVHYADNK